MNWRRSYRSGRPSRIALGTPWWSMDRESKDDTNEDASGGSDNDGEDDRDEGEDGELDIDEDSDGTGPVGLKRRLESRLQAPE